MSTTYWEPLHCTTLLSTSVRLNGKMGHVEAREDAGAMEKKVLPTCDSPSHSSSAHSSCTRVEVQVMVQYHVISGRTKESYVSSQQLQEIGCKAQVQALTGRNHHCPLIQQTVLKNKFGNFTVCIMSQENYSETFGSSNVNKTAWMPRRRRIKEKKNNAPSRKEDREIFGKVTYSRSEYL